MPSPFGLPFRTLQTSARQHQGRDSNPHARGASLTVRCGYHFATLVLDHGSRETRRGHQVGAAGFEPAVSCSQGRRIRPLSHTPRECPAGVEPARSPWQGDRLPLHHGHHATVSALSKIREHRVGFEPTSPRYGRGVFPARPPVRCACVMGPEGLEPSPAWLRARCAAANTLVPSYRTDPIGPGGVEPPSLGYQPSALPLSYKPPRSNHRTPPLSRSAMGPEGFEPPLPGLKGRCAAVTPQPQARPAGFEPARQRLWRPPAPQAHRSYRARQQPVRDSNPPLRLERAVSFSARRTGPGDTRSACRKWAGWRSNPPLHFFRVALDHLSYRPINEKGPVLAAPGPIRSWRPGKTIARCASPPQTRPGTWTAQSGREATGPTRLRHGFQRNVQHGQET